MGLEIEYFILFYNISVNKKYRFFQIVVVVLPLSVGTSIQPARFLGLVLSAGRGLGRVQGG